jgi:deazaflavin-dependent oxidoreductase (nitroreductase family)
MTAASVFLLVAILLSPILLVRFCKRELAAFHRAITNPIACRFAASLPGFGIIENVGRKSGKVYRTPVNVFREKGRFLIALTYGRDSDWVKNVLAAGGAEITTCRVSYLVNTPIVVHDPARRRFPLFVRIILGTINADDFIQLSTSDLGGIPP